MSDTASSWLMAHPKVNTRTASGGTVSCEAADSIGDSYPLGRGLQVFEAGGVGRRQRRPLAGIQAGVKTSGHKQDDGSFWRLHGSEFPAYGSWVSRETHAYGSVSNEQS